VFNLTPFSHGSIFLLMLTELKIMRSILYIIAVICIIAWLLGVFVWSATGLIHILIVLAIISLLFGIIRRA
jgi:hypothetical protein